MHNCGMEKKCYGYDIQAACAGFIVGTYIANAYIKSGLYKKIIVVCAEKMSSMTDYQDRATCPLFGDAAGAVLIEPTENNDEGIIDADYYGNEDNEGHIMVALINHGDEPVEVKKGTRVAQGIFYRYLTADGDEAAAWKGIEKWNKKRKGKKERVEALWVGGE